MRVRFRYGANCLRICRALTTTRSLAEALSRPLCIAEESALSHVRGSALESGPAASYWVVHAGVKVCADTLPHLLMGHCVTRCVKERKYIVGSWLPPCGYILHAVVLRIISPAHLRISQPLIFQNSASSIYLIEWNERCLESVLRRKLCSFNTIRIKGLFMYGKSRTSGKKTVRKQISPKQAFLFPESERKRIRNLQYNYNSVFALL